MRRPETLEELYSPGTKLREVQEDFRGMPLKLWQRLKLDELAARNRQTLNPADAPLSKKAIATPRDSYGWKSL